MSLSPSLDPTISVLRIGPAGPPATFLKNALLSYLPSIASSEGILIISNKYFTARVQLLDLAATKNQERKEDGLIFVFDGLASNPDRPLTASMSTATNFNALDSISKSTEVESTGDLLKMCVGVVLGELNPSEWRGKEHEEEYSRRILWCLDHEMEYVEADLSTEGIQGGHNERDKDGFARIVEAIQGTVWSSANMGEKSPLETLKEKAKTQNSSDGGDREQNQEGDMGAAYEPPPLTLSNPSANTATRPATLSVAEPFIEEETDGEGKRLQRFEGLMRQASDLRDQARSGTLPDEIRRQRAADFVLNLMDSLGMDDDDDYADEDSDVETK